MKITKSKLAAASFGAALTSLYSAPELNAQIINLNFSPGSVAFSGGPASAATVTPIAFTNAVYGSYSVGGNNASVGVFNNGTYGVSFVRNLGFNNDLIDFGVVQAGDFFTGSENNGTVFENNINFAPAVTGVQYIGFVFRGSVGWFGVDLGQPGDAIQFTGGQFLDFSDGASFPEPFGITVGSAVPEPSSAGLAALALGAIGLRRRRKAAA